MKYLTIQIPAISLIMSHIPIFTSVYATCKEGKIRLVIEAPSFDIPFEERNNLIARKIKDSDNAKKWLINQMEKVENALKEKQDAAIDLASNECPIRLGGGFMEYDDKGIFLIYRTNKKNERLLADICAGTFESSFHTPFEMMFAESLEILRIKHNKIYIPTHSKFKNVILSEYKENIEQYLPISTQKIDLISGKITSMKGKEVCYQDECYPFTFTYEPSNLSIEIVGLLKTEHLDMAQYIDGEISGTTHLNRPIIRINFSGNIEIWQNGECVENQISEKIPINKKVHEGIKEFLQLHPEHSKSIMSWIKF